MRDQTLVSLSGNPIYTYNEGPNEFQPATEKSNRDLITSHIEQHIGPISCVFREIHSDTVRIDIHHILPSKERPFHTLVTSGMSDLAMHLPANIHATQHMELVAVLPEYWKISQTDFENESWYWPIRQLKFLARFPHKYNSWLGWGHTIPNNEPAEPFADNTRLSAIMLLPPIHAANDFHSLKISTKLKIEFLSIVPISKDEMFFKLRNGPSALLEIFQKHNITDLIEIKRKCCICKRFGLF